MAGQWCRIGANLAQVRAYGAELDDVNYTWCMRLCGGKTAELDSQERARAYKTRRRAHERDCSHVFMGRVDSFRPDGRRGVKLIVPPIFWFSHHLAVQQCRSRLRARPCGYFKHQNFRSGNNFNCMSTSAEGQKYPFHVECRFKTCIKSSLSVWISTPRIMLCRSTCIATYDQVQNSAKSSRSM